MTSPIKTKPAIAMLNNDGYKEMLYLLAQVGTPQSAVLERVRIDYQIAALRLEGGHTQKAAARIHIHRNTMTRHQGNEGEGT